LQAPPQPAHRGGGEELEILLRLAGAHRAILRGFLARSL
jgi:hypothetical protein